ncbi:FG-GAP repeat protein [Nonomuraea sp. NPDC004186]
MLDAQHVQSFGVSLQLSDFNKDGRADLALAIPTESAVAVLPGSSDGVNTTRPTFISPDQGHHAQAGHRLRPLIDLSRPQPNPPLTEARPNCALARRSARHLALLARRMRNDIGSRPARLLPGW